MFGEHPPEKELKPPKGISWPAKNSSEDIQKSTCAIINYFSCHILNITRNLINGYPDNLTATVDAFKINFEAAARRAHFQPCTAPCGQSEMTASYHYTKKVLGLRILHFSRKWVAHFANDTCHA